MSSHDNGVRLIEGALVLNKGHGLNDWYLIERAVESYNDGDGNVVTVLMSPRISDADVEGRRVEMLAIAKAIEERSLFGAKRCAVEVIGEFAEFWSPRNSHWRGRVPLAVADALVKQIRSVK